MIKKNPAFTLVELLVAITIFVIFIAFSMLSFSVFHRTQVDAATSREMLFELSHVMELLTEAIKENKIDYEYYEDEDASAAFGLLSGISSGISSSSSLSTTISNLNGQPLVLLSLDGNTRTIFEWSAKEKTLSLQKFTKNSDDEFVEADGFLEPLVLNGETFSVEEADFRIFPESDPYNSDNFEDGVFYQPNVKIKLTFSTPGRSKPEIIVDLESTVTAKIYK